MLFKPPPNPQSTPLPLLEERWEEEEEPRRSFEIPSQLKFPSPALTAFKIFGRDS